MGKTVVLVTGASRGLGLALAGALAQKDYIIYSGVRTLDQAAEGTIPIWLDLTKEESLLLCVENIIKEQGRIDILINNAGVAYWGAVDSMTLQEARELFECNFFGTFRLTQLVIPYMRDKRSGKILFVSSIRGVESCAYMGMYSASKAALEAIAFDWAVTLEQWNISVSIVQPGPMATGIEIKHGNYFLPPDKNPYLPYGDVVIEWQPLQEVCSVILENLKLTPMPFRFQTNENSEAIIAKHLRDPSGMKWYQEQKELITGTRV